jgi:hypothetical protein
MQVFATTRFARVAAFVLAASVVAPARAAPANIEIYLALGEPGAVHVEGRVLGGTRRPDEDSADRPLLNLLRTALAVASDELPAVDAAWAARNEGRVESIWILRVPGSWAPARNDVRFLESREGADCGGR